MSASMMKRADAPREATWNAESLFANWPVWEAELEAVQHGISELADYAGKLGSNPDTLANYLEKRSHYRRRIIRLFTYVGVAADVYNNDSTAQSNRGRMMSLTGQFAAITAFDAPEMQAIDEKLLRWANDNSRLSIYSHYFDNLLREKTHTRSAEVEEVLGMVQDPFDGVWGNYRALAMRDLHFQDAIDSQGNNHPVAQATVTPTGIQSSDREHRRTAWGNYCDAHIAYENTFASNYITLVKQQVFLARVHGYDSVLQSRLEPNSVPVEVFHNLINTFQANLETWHRYWAAKAKLLGIDQLHPWDIWAPIVKDDPAVPYAQAVEWISDGMQPLGKEYVDVMRRGCLDERWVDWAPNEGKMQGARSSWAADSHPFIIMGYNETLMSMSVLAHELGHSMHSYLMDKTQPDIYNGGISSSVAETASNFNQAMTRAYLVTTFADDANFQRALIDETLFNFHRYFFQMPTLARFEYEVFDRAEKGMPLNADILNGILREFYEEGYGDTMAGELDRTQITWAQFGHLYAPFYTFQYAVGISAAHALADGVLAGESRAAERYVEFLSAGSSLYTMDLFELAGVDMSTPEPIEKTFAVLASVVERMEALAQD